MLISVHSEEIEIYNTPIDLPVYGEQCLCFNYGE